MGNFIVQVQELYHNYASGFQALEGVNFSVKPGEFIALVGQNGAGKTTLVKHLNGLLRPSSGRILIDGKDIAAEKISSLARKIGFVFQNPDHQIFHDRIDKEVGFGPQNLGLAKSEVTTRVAKALQAVGLGEYSMVSPLELSKGQRQRVALASVLAMETEVIVFDEPTTGQDYKESLQIMDIVAGLNKQGHTILFITHDMSLVARYASRVVVMCEGKVSLDGPPEQVFMKVEELSKTFVKPPQICQLALALGIKEGVLSPAELVDRLGLGGVQNVCCG